MNYQHTRILMFQTFLTRIRDGANKQSRLLLKRGEISKLNEIIKFLNWIAKFLTHSTYPDAASTRIGNMLEFYRVLLEVFDKSEDIEFIKAMHKQKQSDSSFIPVPLSLETKDSVKSILSCLWSEFEKDRQISFGITILLIINLFW